ncbi:MAG: PepSY domain-containing protein [Vicinamibacterales bacterium]
MTFNVLNRKIHYWLGAAIALPLGVIIATGLLLQIKKQWSWVQPPEQKRAVEAPALALPAVLEIVRAVPHLGVTGWHDVDRVDVRPGKGIAKVILTSGWEAQLHLGTGEVLQTAYRRSDLIEAIHDGSFFGGDATKLGLFLPVALALFTLWLGGLWMWWVPFAAKRRRARIPAATAATGAR